MGREAIIIGTLALKAVATGTRLASANRPDHQEVANGKKAQVCCN
jgi:hypothetical protein